MDEAVLFVTMTTLTENGSYNFVIDSTRTPFYLFFVFISCIFRKYLNVGVGRLKTKLE